MRNDMPIENFPRREVGLPKTEESVLGFEKSIEIAKHIVDSIAEREKGKALEKKTKGEYVEWEKLTFDEKEVRLDLADDLLSGAYTLEELKDLWYDFKSSLIEGAYEGDYEEIQKDVLAITGVARLIKEKGMKVYFADPIYDEDNCLWVDPNQPKTPQRRDRLWKVRIQLVPNTLIAPKQSISIKKENDEMLEYGEDQHRFFSVREVKFLLGYQNLNALDASGNWINPEAKEKYDEAFEQRFGR